MIQRAMACSEIVLDDDPVWKRWKVDEEDRRFDTVLEVTSQTTLECMREAQAGRSMVLSFGSAKRPGGGYLGGASAQEESLARSSALVPCLERFEAQFYQHHARQKGDDSCLYSHRIIWSPNVPFWRSDAGTALPVHCATVATVAAVNAGVVSKRVDRRVAPLMIAAHMHQRIRRVLLAALRKGCEDLVLGAFGCGVFKNAPRDVAFLFRALLLGEFRGCFARVRFALSAGSAENLAAFEEVLLRGETEAVGSHLLEGSHLTYQTAGVAMKDRTNARKAARDAKFRQQWQQGQITE